MEGVAVGGQAVDVVCFRFLAMFTSILYATF
jgi:hypothetical protein